MTTLAGAFWAPAEGHAPRLLVVLCHGAAANGEAMTRMAKVLSELMPDAALAAPHGPQPSAARPGARDWFSPPYTQPLIGPRVAAATAVLDDFIDGQLQAANLPPDAYVMGGFSQGALVSLQAGLRRKVPPRAILAVAGVLVNPLPPLSAPPPVLLISGLLDSLVTPKLVRETEATLRDAGVAVESHYIPGLGHEVTPPVITIGATFLHNAVSNRPAKRPPG